MINYTKLSIEPILCRKMYVCCKKFCLTSPVHSHHYTLRTGLSDGFLNAGDLLSVHCPPDWSTNETQLQTIYESKNNFVDMLII